MSRIFLLVLTAGLGICHTWANSTNLFPAASVTFSNQLWTLAGLRQQVVLNPATLGLILKGPTNTWRFAPSQEGDLVVRREEPGAPNFTLELAKAGRRQITPYETGYGSGLKIELAEFSAGGQPLDLELTFLLTLEGAEEDLVCEVLAADKLARMRELSWPRGLDPESFDTTVVPFMQGMLLPKDWPEKAWLYDHLSFGRGLYMPWWGWQKAGGGALLAVLETPADGGCRFQHPAGGPTRTDVLWVHSLNRWAYPRRARFCTLEGGDYVSLAKRYRRQVIAEGRFVSLKEKIARNPLVGRLIGSPIIHTGILTHIQPESQYYHKDDPAQNHHWVSFADRAKELERLRERGISRAYVHLDGWGVRGYDNLHPDPLPPCGEAGGWEGMKLLAATCDRLGYLFAIHDQYRDYYWDAPSYQARHAVVDASGQRPTHGIWYGGKQSLLCPRLAPGHVRKNHLALLDHGVQLRGAYLDVFSVVPPDECYAPEHPVTRAECLRYRGQCLDFVRGWGGIVSSEEPSDWSIPHLDLVHHGPYGLRPDPGSGPAMGIPVPLFNLVYHEALLIPWSSGRGAWGIPEKDLGFLHGLGNAGLPYVSTDPDEKELQQVRTLCALHQRVGLLEMTGHRFLDPQRRRQEFTYSDGTRVVIDLNQDAYTVSPPL